ncbi:MAG TPA: hypothetical protein DIW81_30535 [Planctomycetaceae bacterium]|nr:hypothetical protein [Planctomycetaceae bacterium]
MILDSSLLAAKDTLGAARPCNGSGFHALRIDDSDVRLRSSPRFSANKLDEFVMKNSWTILD